MDYIAKAEGKEIHYNSTELDITCWGIYKHVHPDAEIFKYINKIALEELGIITDSADWTGFVITRVNEAVDKDVMYALAVEFYEEYLKGAKLELFNDDCKVVAMSLYTNAPKLLWSSVQQALISLQKAGKLNKELVMSTVDGLPGSKTYTGLIEANNSVTGAEFKQYMLLGGAKYYADVVANDVTKVKYINGWINRLIYLSEI